VEAIDVKILDRDYRLAVSDDEKARLLDAVSLVDERMRDVRDAGRVQNTDRIAVMAALQLAHELLGLRAGRGSVVGGADLVRKIQRMNAELDEEIKRQESLF
jgi:cell division protein ZapA